MWSLTKRARGTMLHAAPAFANHGTNFACSVFARVIVALLVEAQAPELKHLWVFADDEPRSDSERGKGHHRQQAKPNEENRNADEYDRHPCCKIETKLGSRSIQRLIDCLRFSSPGHSRCHLLHRLPGERPDPSGSPTENSGTEQ